MACEQGQVDRFGFHAQEWCRRNSRLSAPNRDAISTLVGDLASDLSCAGQISVGLAGAPGSGKSTLAGALVHSLRQSGLAACCLSLDDYYLCRSDRERLAAERHPLFLRRGAPGSHELERLTEDLDRLAAGESGDIRLPVFDKSSDDRLP